MWSGGKDSTATIIYAKGHGLPIDEILFSEVMYDKSRNISGENPEEIKWVREVAIPTFRSWGYKVTVVRDSEDFWSLFHKPVRGAIKKPWHNGMWRGFPCSFGCWAKRDLKLRPINRYMKELSQEKGEVVRVLGICADEPKRLVSMHKNPATVSYLEEAGMTESDCAKLCRKHNLLSPLYSLNNGCQKRGGCWFCCWSKPEEHRAIKELYPDVYEEFVGLEDKWQYTAGDRWNPFRGRLRDFINNP